MRTYAALASGHRKAVLGKLLACLLRPIPGFTYKLQKTDVVLLEYVTVDRGCPPLRCRCREVSRWWRRLVDVNFHGREATASREFFNRGLKSQDSIADAVYRRGV
jgi:hypothetical protein